MSSINCNASKGHQHCPRNGSCLKTEECCTTRPCHVHREKIGTKPRSWHFGCLVGLAKIYWKFADTDVNLPMLATSNASPKNGYGWPSSPWWSWVTIMRSWLCKPYLGCSWPSKSPWQSDGSIELSKTKWQSRFWKKKPGRYQWKETQVCCQGTASLLRSQSVSTGEDPTKS